jgi:hypothetical protein
MIRPLILVAFLVLPVAAQAQTAPPTFTVPAQVMQHVVTYLANGGTHAEGGALAEQLSVLAQQQIQAAAQKPPETPAK